MFGDFSVLGRWDNEGFWQGHARGGEAVLEMKSWPVFGVWRAREQCHSATSCGEINKPRMPLLVVRLVR